jgi:DNA-binding transcriptional MocR family regulator
MTAKAMDPALDLWRQTLVAVSGGASKVKILVQAIGSDIDGGRLAEGVRLPTQRELSQRLGISVQTVTNAYKELERHGVIRCEVGRGSFVARRVSEGVSSTMLDHAEPSLADFSTARIVHTSLHDLLWRDACAALAQQPDQPWMRECRPVAGFENHRAAGVDWLASLGMPSSVDRLVVTNGTSHAVFLALAMLARPGDVVLCEDVTDHGVIGAAQVLGFTLKGLDCDDCGIQPSHFEDMCANERITALVCTPNFNNPTMTLMPMAHRQAIARIADKYGVHVIEDDVFGPLLVDRLPPVSSLVPDLGHYCTSFTKSVLTGLRTGYLSVPGRHALRAESILRVSSWMATPLLAEIASRWVADGSATRLLEAQREQLARRHWMLHDRLGDHVIGSHPNALAAWLATPDGWQLDSLVRQLRERDVAVTRPDPFLVRGTPRPDAIRLCLGAEGPEAHVDRALATIAAVYAQQPRVHDQP